MISRRSSRLLATLSPAGLADLAAGLDLVALGVRKLRIEFDELTGSTTSALIFLQVKIGGVPITTGYEQYLNRYLMPAASGAGTTSAAGVCVGSDRVSGHVIMYDLDTGATAVPSVAGRLHSVTGGSSKLPSGATQDIIIAIASGTFASGTVKIYAEDN